MDLSVRIGSIILQNPVTIASGTAGYGENISKYIDISKIGAIFTKGLTLEPKKGNRGNRIIETPSGILNSIGLENVGLRDFIDNKLPFLIKNKALPIPNIAGHTEEENVELCGILSSTEGIDALELNVSCPNVKRGGIAFGTDMRAFTGLMEKVRRVTSCTLIVKLSPNVTDITEFAVRAEETGADALSAVNTYIGMKIDIKKRKPHFINRVAGLSGPAIRPMALASVYRIYEKVNIPVIGIGGISSLEDMLEFIMAGAAAVSVGTMNMIDPDTSMKLINELENYMEENRFDSIKRLIGAAHS